MSIYKISYDLSQDYLKFIVRPTHYSALRCAKISVKNIVREYKTDTEITKQSKFYGFRLITGYLNLYYPKTIFRGPIWLKRLR